MYKPSFNTVLVEIDTEDDKWGRGNDESYGGKSYSKGKIVSAGDLLDRHDYPINGINVTDLTDMVGKQIMWNEGHEAGTLFEEDDKLYGFIYWWDLRGVRE